VLQLVLLSVLVHLKLCLVAMGGGSFFTRATAIFATIFFCTSLGLALIAKNHSKISSDALPIPAAAQQAPAAPANEVPVSECTRRAEPNCTGSK